jgi:hypothetical protein
MARLVLVELAQGGPDQSKPSGLNGVLVGNYYDITMGMLGIEPASHTRHTIGQIGERFRFERQ